MYAHSVPTDVSMLVYDIAQFLASSGYSVAASDDLSLTNAFEYNPNQGLAITPGSGMVLATAVPRGILGNIPNNSPISFSAKRIVAKDPAGSCYVHLLFYTFGYAVPRDGSTETAWYADAYLSTGWDPGAGFDAQPGIVKFGFWYSLPPSGFVGMDMFSGLTSAGRLWAHFAVEEKPLVWSHMGIGSLEKTVDFTGGDYAQMSTVARISGQGYNGTHPYASYGRWYSADSNMLMLQNSFYAPDLDVPNKRYPASQYRSTAGTGAFTTERLRSDLEMGSSSFCFRFDANGLDGNYVGNGSELTPISFPLPNVWSGGSPLFPIYVSAIDGSDFNYSCPVGYFKGVRAMDVSNYNPGDEISLGPDTWRVYPCRTKIQALSYAWTSNQGFAVLK
jgi:hypothetical protein